MGECRGRKKAEVMVEAGRYYTGKRLDGGAKGIAKGLGRIQREIFIGI